MENLFDRFGKPLRDYLNDCPLGYETAQVWNMTLFYGEAYTLEFLKARTNQVLLDRNREKGLA